MTAPTITDDELQAVLDGPAGPALPPVAWLQQLKTGTAPTLPLPVLCEIASEEDSRGALATVHTLLEGLITKHSGDDATCAALVAVLHLHLPAALDGRR
jgi:hypothetical protein